MSVAAIASAPCGAGKRHSRGKAVSTINFKQDVAQHAVQSRRSSKFLGMAKRAVQGCDAHLVEMHKEIRRQGDSSSSPLSVDPPKDKELVAQAKPSSVT